MVGMLFKLKKQGVEAFQDRCRSCGTVFFKELSVKIVQNTSRVPKTQKLVEQQSGNPFNTNENKFMSKPRR